MAIPTDQWVAETIAAQKPDVVLVTPLVDIASDQVEYVKAARTLGVGSLEAGLALIQMLLPLSSEVSGEPGVDLVRRQVGSRRSGHKWTPLRSG